MYPIHPIIRTVRFLDRFKVSENSLCNVFREQASRHMSEFSSKFGVPELSSWWLLRDAIYARIPRSLVTASEL